MKTEISTFGGETGCRGNLKRVISFVRIVVYLERPDKLFMMSGRT